MDKQHTFTTLPEQIAELNWEVVKGHNVEGSEKWQPIETAPRDGTMVLVFRAPETGYEKRVYGVDYTKGGEWWLSRTQMQPTHWMPLPPPPPK
jgi:Protein of unknown function (DUF551)